MHLVVGLRNNYNYDSIGNLTKDLLENIPDGGITWNAYGKIMKVYHSSTSWDKPVKQVSYTYDAAGNRVSKRVVNDGSTTVHWTWYVRDASGNVMANYTSVGDSLHRVQLFRAKLG